MPAFVLFIAFLIATFFSNNEAVESSAQSRFKRSLQMTEKRAGLTQQEVEQLQRLYGDKFDLDAAETVKAMGMAIESKNSPRLSTYYGSASRAGRNRGVRSYPAQLWNNRNLYRNKRMHPPLASIRRRRPRQNTEGFDSPDYSGARQVYNYPPNQLKSDPDQDTTDEECSLYGTWVSALAGVAIELQPGNGGIAVKLTDLPETQNSRFLSSSWTGSVMLSPISATTITILFQEVSTVAPGTAVFTGQCVSCRDGTAIQGSWVIFGPRQCPSTQVFSNNSSTSPRDRLYRFANPPYGT